MFFQNKTVAAFSCSNGLLLYIYIYINLANNLLLHATHTRKVRIQG